MSIASKGAPQEEALIASTEEGSGNITSAGQEEQAQYRNSPPDKNSNFTVSRPDSVVESPAIVEHTQQQQQSQVQLPGQLQAQDSRGGEGRGHEEPAVVKMLPATRVGTPPTPASATCSISVGGMASNDERLLMSNTVGVALGVPSDLEAVDWTAALEQCSGDMSFLEELLVDLWTESGEHAQQLRDSVPRGKCLEVQHEAHSIKGAAANLMCHRLRSAALFLEKAGFVGTKLIEGAPEAPIVHKAMVLGMKILEDELVTLSGVLKDKNLI